MRKWLEIAIVALIITIVYDMYGRPLVAGLFAKKA